MAVSSSFGTDEIVHLNVGGTRFSTSKQTLTWVPDSFFTGLLSNRIASHKDEQGAIFIDRDPSLFSIVLNYLRTKHVNLSNVDIRSLKHEAEYYGITPLVKRLMLCEDLSHSTCGDILFIGYLKPPNVPSQDSCSTSESNTDTPAEVPANMDPLKVQIIRADQNCIVVAYAHFVTCYQHDHATGLEHIFTSPRVDSTIERVAISTKYSPSAGIDIAFSYGSQVRLWSLYKDGVRKRPVDLFDLNARVEYLFFIGNQLVALSSTGAIGVRHAMTHHWQRQNVVPTLSFETAGSLLLLGCNNGSIYYIDMEKFPLRMKDNDLLVTELYRDPNREPITAISVYLTPKTSACGIWIEIAYGTKSGTVRIVTQHPETGVYAPKLFQSFTAHQSSVSKVSLSNKYLVSVCSDYNHVRSWAVTRCAGMLSYPGPSPNASFKLVSLEAIESCVSYNAGNDYGPYGEQDDEQVFIQKVVPETDQLHVRLASNGKRVCVIKSVNNSVISSFFVHELQNPSEERARSMRVIFTGHSNGTVQMWDLTTALQSWYSATRGVRGGPTPEELWRFLDQCDLSNSHCSTPCISPSPSLASAMPVSHPSNILVLNQSQSSEPTTRPSQK